MEYVTSFHGYLGCFIAKYCIVLFCLFASNIFGYQSRIISFQSTSNRISVLFLYVYCFHFVFTRLVLDLLFFFVCFLLLQTIHSPISPMSSLIETIEGPRKAETMFQPIFRESQSSRNIRTVPKQNKSVKQLYLLYLFLDLSFFLKLAIFFFFSPPPLSKTFFKNTFGFWFFFLVTTNNRLFHYQA